MQRFFVFLTKQKHGVNGVHNDLTRPYLRAGGFVSVSMCIKQKEENEFKTHMMTIREHEF